MPLIAPIALFCYNRLSHTQRTVEALRANSLASESDLWIFSDGPRSQEDLVKVQKLRSYLTTITGFRAINLVERANNMGLAASIIAGVSELCDRFGRIIVVEDDLITAPFFLEFMNEALDIYADTDEVVSIHGYVFPSAKILPDTFFLKGADCWGWATWKRGWKLFNHDGAGLLEQLESRGLSREFDFDNTMGYTQMLRDQIAGKVNSWAIRWYASAFLENKLTLYPGISLVQNIGHDGSGVHCGISNTFDVSVAERKPRLQKLPLIQSVEGRKAFESYFNSQRRLSLVGRIKRFFLDNKCLCC